jgi:hypothetical protein
MENFDRTLGELFGTTEMSCFENSWYRLFGGNEFDYIESDLEKKMKFDIKTPRSVFEVLSN